MSEIATRTPQQELVAAIRGEDSQAQIAAALDGSGITPAKFVRVAITAINENAALVNADRPTLFSALIRCATDGLLPDGREAALVMFGQKVQYIAMIGGYRKIMAEHGWMLRTAVVYENDEFDYTEEPPTLMHKPAPPGEERGALRAAYAIAQHRDGRRMQRVLDADAIAKVRKVARTQQVWNEWTAQMWEKSAGRDLFQDVPLDEKDRERVARVIDASAFADPVATLYGPTQTTPAALGPGKPAENPTPPPAEATAEATGPVPQQDPPPAAATDADWTPIDEPPDDVEAVTAAAATVIPSGVYKDRSFADVAGLENGPAWFLTQLKRVSADAPVRPTLEVFVRAMLPDQWAQYVEWRDAQ